MSCAVGKGPGRAGWIREQWDTYPHSRWNAQGEAVEGVEPHRALQEKIPEPGLISVMPQVLVFSVSV